MIAQDSSISEPIRTLDQLIQFTRTVEPRGKSGSERYESTREKILFCHDMQGGYLNDRYDQGCETNEICYRFFRWHLIDIFVYFSHELVTIPPSVWIETAHKNGVDILGTFITEFEAGHKICDQLFQTDEMVDHAIDSLVRVMLYYDFDGYLINIENPIKSEHLSRLVEFVRKLNLACKKAKSNSTIIWYDSVTKDGDLRWQNQLNDMNEVYFRACDGIFLNYTWKPDYLLQSKINAGHRDRDVFVGIDVFGRGCLGDGGFNTCEALKHSHALHLSSALFAPGWLHETLDKNDFLFNDQKFWSLLESYMPSRSLKLKSFSTFFSDGFGDQFFIHGHNFVDHRWYHLGLQSYLPNSSSSHQWILNHSDAYFGGSSLEIKVKRDQPFHLFNFLIPVKSTINLTIVSKSLDHFIIELKLDQEKSILLEQATTVEMVRNWKRQTYVVELNEAATLHDIFVRCEKNIETTIQIGFLSINIVEPVFQPTNQLVQSIDQCSDGSCVLKFSKNFLGDNDSTIILVLIRDTFECYRFLGATRKNFFYMSSLNFEQWKTSRSTMIIRQYDLDSLKLINEQLQV